MITLLRKLFKWTAYTVAGLVILLAVAVGLLRLFLPQLEDYQDQIKVWAGDAIGMDVNFSGMDARWGLSGPEIKFLDAELIRRDNDVRVVQAEEVSVSIALIRLVAERTVAIDRVIVRESTVELRQLDDGSFRVQGSALDELLPQQPSAAPADLDIEFVGEDIDLLYLASDAQRPVVFEVDQLVFESAGNILALDAAISLADSLGQSAMLSATQMTSAPIDDRFWDIDVELDEVNLAGASALIGLPGLQIDGGQGDLSIALRIDAAGLQEASADLDLSDVEKEGIEPIDLESHVEYRRDDDGWLLAANRLRLSTAGGVWPETSFRIDTGFDGETPVLVDVQAEYLKLEDLALFAPLFDEQTRTLIDRVRPRGVVRDLDATYAASDGGDPAYTVSVEVEELGFDAYEQYPGLRGLSARARADDTGGRVEIASEDVELQLFDYVNMPIDLDLLSGTLIWRQSGDQLTVLSDNIELRNPIIEMQTNVQVTVDGDASPVVDLGSRWRITDLGAAKRYIPQKIVKPRLYSWFQNALVSGYIDDGTTTFNGPIDKFPFDNGEGRFLLNATVKDSLFRYLLKWPTSELRYLEVTLENTRLYTTRNLSYAEGREIRDAEVDIADLRNPVLTINGRSTGDMQSLLRFSRNSPIDGLLGGQLERVSVDGTATTDLELRVPLKSWRDFEMTTTVDTQNATVAIDGLPPELTDVSGRVIIERAAISSEDLTATFLGETINVDLARASEALDGYSVVANIDGRASVIDIAQQFEVPIDRYASGGFDYTANVLFPRGQSGKRLAVGVATDLNGARIDLPPPFGRSEEESTPVSAGLRFLDGMLETTGRSEVASWDILITAEDGLEVDRGNVFFGDADISETPDTRGLHLRGDLERFDINEWLALRDESGRNDGLVELIRSADVDVANLAVIGQRYGPHRVRLDRSARDWQIAVSGDELTGNVTLPYVFSSDTTLILDMQRLWLPGDGEDEGGEAEEPAQLDPRGFPAIELRADDFMLGERKLGRVEARVERSADGLLMTSMTATDPSFDIAGTGAWVADAADPDGFRTSLSGTLASSDIKATMRQLGFAPGINGREMNVEADINWSGGPNAEFLETIDGLIDVRMGPGQLDDIDPGAGRVLGLTSIVALPRRLALDFSDVFQKGFAFDDIHGTFRLVDGDSYTCNLSLEGPAAAIGIVGRAGLAAEDYEQAAIVSANFGNSLPIGVGLVAGPQAAVAALIFSQIFKKPLQEMSQVYYEIDGTFDAPSMESSDASEFAERGRIAGCLDTEGA